MAALSDAFRSTLTEREREIIDAGGGDGRNLTTLQLISLSLFQGFQMSLFKDTLIDGDRIATGFELPISLHSRRKIIPSTIWPLLELNIKKEQASGHGLRIGGIEIFNRNDKYLCSIYDDVLDLREEKHPLKSASARDFYQFSYQGIEFRCGPNQAAVLNCLYGARQNGSGWVSGKEVLDTVGSNSATIADLFKSKKNWRSLIESDRRGRYRLSPSYVHQH